MQKRGKRTLLVEVMLLGEIEHVDAAQLAIGHRGDRLLDGGDTIGVGRLPQHIEKSFRFAHRSRSSIPSRAPR